MATKDHLHSKHIVDPVRSNGGFNWVHNPFSSDLPFSSVPEQRKRTKKHRDYKVMNANRK